MRVRHYLACLVPICSIILTACSGNSGGTPRNPVNLEVYGLVRGATVADSKTYSVESLQAFIAPGNPFSFTGIFTGVCQSLSATGSSTAVLFAQFLCTKNIFETSILVNHGIDLFNFVSNNTAGVASTRFYRFIYNTPGAPFTFAGGATTPQDVSGLIIVPLGSDGNPLPQNKIKGAVLYFHATITSKGGVPSDFDATDPVSLQNALNKDLMLAAIYAAQGYIVIAPDYIGQGVNIGVMHPFTAPAKANAQSGIYALKAARTALANQGINLPTMTNLYVTSYSEGGAYALWTSRLAQTEYQSVLNNSGYTLRRTAGISGAYDLSGAMFSFMFANAINSWDPQVNVWNISPGMFESGLPGFIPASSYPQLRTVAAIEAAGSKVVLSGYTLTTLIYYNSTTAAFTTLSYPTFVQMNQCLNVASYTQSGTTLPSQNIGSCPLTNNLPSLFNDQTGKLNTTQIFQQALDVSGATNNFLTGGMTFSSLLQSIMQTGNSNNSAGALINPKLLIDPVVMQNVIPQDIAGGWSTTNPLELIYLRYDSTLTNVNSLEACGLVPSFIGVKNLSASGMVNCTQVDNTSLFQQSPVPGLATLIVPPIFMDHGNAEPILQIVALNKFLTNP